MRRVHRQGLIIERRRVEEVIDLLAVDLEEGHRDGITTCGFELHCFLEEPSCHFRDNAIELPHFLRCLLSLHCKSLPGTSLPIGEDRTMIPLQSLIDHLLDPALPKHFILITLFPQQIITPKGLPMRLVPHNHLFSL